ncbi:MAG: heme ABC exporter ATP-binding protein CcmA [Hyphomicrobiaceae bacterium]
MQLTIESLGCERGGRTIIDGLSLTAAAGEAVLLTGPNGAGKTTLLRTIAGFLPPATGTMRLTDVPEGEPVAEHCHYIGHLNAVKPRLSVEENLAFWRDFLGDSQREAGHGSPEGIIDAALDRLGLLHLAATPAGYLSAGQRRRLALARLLVAHRPVWLLDEPTVSLDVASVATFAGVVEEHLAAGGLVLAATHVPLGLTRTRELRMGAARVAA